MKCLVIADDFTGANDTGMQLARRGCRTEVFFQVPEVTKADTSVIIDTESRHLACAEAYEKVYNMMQNIDFAEFTYVIKKVDSTLRGNIAWEIKAADDRYQSELLVFMPALPALGRTTVNGIHFLNGVRISETELGKDPGFPVKQDHITELLQTVYEELVAHISIEDIQSGNIDFSKCRIFTADAENDAQMHAVISAALQTGKKVLFVGTAALMDVLMEIQHPTAPAMGLIGSISEVTRKQIYYAKAQGCEVLQLNIAELMKQKLESERQNEPIDELLETYVQQAVTVLENGRDLLVVSDASWDRSAYDKTVMAAREMGMAAADTGEYTQQILGEIGRKILEQKAVSGVFLAGGDTAKALFQALGAYGSEITGEIAIGIPGMKLVGGIQDGLKVVSKAGAFGNQDAIVYALRKLKEG